MRILRSSLLSWAVGVVLSPIVSRAGAQSGDWKHALRDSLEQRIKISKTSSDQMRITEVGTPLTIQVDGVSAGVASDKTMFINHASTEGAVRQARGLAVALAGKKNNRDFQVGERVYMKELDIDDDKIDVVLVSQQTYPVMVNGNTTQTRYRAALRFDFPKNYLATATSADVQAVLGKVLKVEGAAAQPASVELGQSVSQVEAAFGKPEKVLKLGNKTIYVYKDVKVTFVEGKVTDVQ